MSITPDFQNSTWLQTPEAQGYCWEHPTNNLCQTVPAFYENYCLYKPVYPLCNDVDNFYDYRIDIVPNAVFLGIFSASLASFLVIWAVTRRGTAFNLAIILGLICEVLGYAGRVMSWQNQWQENGFLIQICCLTIGPAFMAAGIYLCLRRIVTAFGPENSRIPPEYYTRIFIPCDVISLVLQALGGALASIASHNHDSADLGSNIMIAGLAFQVITLVAFVITVTDFSIRTYRRSHALGDAALDQDPVLVHLRSTRCFKAFLGALALATLCVLWRSAFRVAELSEGWTGPIMGDQGMFIGFEGVLIVVAILALNIFHPALCMKELLEAGGGLKGLWCAKSRKNKGEVGEKDSPRSLSDVESKPVTADGQV